MIAAFAASVLAFAAVQDTTSGVPGTAMRFGAESSRFGAAQGFQPSTRPQPGIRSAREGDMRFFGIDAHATLTFLDRALIQVEFLIDQASPHQVAYVEDELARRGFRRGCSVRDRANSDCVWTGPVLVHLVRQERRVMATIVPPGAESALNAAAARQRRGPPLPAGGDSLAAAGGAMALAGAMTGGGAAGTGSRAIATPADTGVTGAVPAPAAPAATDLGIGVMHPDTLALPVGWRSEDFLVVESPAPAYPAKARAAGVQGIVRTLALVDSAGAVREVQVTRGIAELDSAAVAAVRAMRFRPRVLDGRAVAGWIRVPITFTLH